MVPREQDLWHGMPAPDRRGAPRGGGGRAASGGLPRRLEGVAGDDPAGPPAVGRVVDLAARQRRALAEVDRLDPRAAAADVALLAEPVEPVREEREDVDL